MRTTSLRLRVVAAVLAVLAVVLLVVGVLTHVVLGEQLRANLQERLLDRAGYAQILADQGLAAQSLADQLTGDNISVAFSREGDTVYGRADPAPRSGKRPGPPGSPPPDALITQSGTEVTVTQTVAGGTLSLSASEAGIDETLAQLRTIEIIAATIALVVTGLLLTGVVGVALRPLTRMTEVFTGITNGDRGGRLRPSNPGTDIGQTARAIDDMLQTLETAETTARCAEQAATRAEERMRHLLADVSHELRTPIAGLQASAETLLRANPARAERERLTVGMIQQTQRAARLVGDLVLMTRLDQGGDGDARLPEAVNPAALLTRVVADQRLLAADRTIELRIDTELWVRGDVERLRQIVTNLLDNARHATAPGGLIVVTLCSTVDETGVQVRVSDSGPGVAPADRQRIFDRFVRLDESRKNHQEGSGLGLPIARALAHAHGGTLDYVSTSTGEAHAADAFVLTLPAVAPNAAVTTAVGPAPRP
ncbi:HAMP domain-containing sensor histidine kinase [Cryobacterium sp. CG_9.6]|uniref:sensor histidine kinase n=1 Tax=Cryobacterium sp. CG_9.6 TaxID=2760710 RepID=UPI00247581F2|nr:HAMP domain-containing sensor histidine kinase [Cryobacterium sp. CG_9.6]MDH6237718.1 signal transduction histidine kinase [Cryobacterium sp. CG_9.6]